MRGALFQALVALIALVCAMAVQAEPTETTPHVVGAADQLKADLATFGLDSIGQPYAPVLGAFDNPNPLLADPIPAIPHYPDCGVRPQTVVEIQRMRETSSRIVELINQEMEVMVRRKTYIEQMSSYLNDRIQELNMVKADLREEIRWIEDSQNRIAEMAEREKLIKLQDVLSCLRENQNQVNGKATLGKASIDRLLSQQKTLQSNIDAIKAKIEKPASASSSVPASPLSPLSPSAPSQPSSTYEEVGL